jgi:uncharacterized protein (TIGR00251 family)
MAAERDAVEIAAHGQGVALSVKVVPGASRSRVVGPWGGALRVTVAAPPEGGRANAALIALLAAQFGVKKSDVTIVTGHGQPLKRVAIRGLNTATARQRLG